MAEQNPPARERLYAANAAAAAFYAAQMGGSKKAATYLESHGISAAAHPGELWQVGYAPGRWTHLATHLLGAGFSAEEVTAAGLGFVHRTSGHLLDRFRDRLMFPITDEHNRVIAFTARDLSSRAESKWINSPENALYRKRRVLYGLGQQLAHQPSGVGNPVVFVVEGAADVLAMHRMAIAHSAIPETQPAYAVAPCGTKLARDHLDLLQRALPGAHLILAFDGDDAGRKAISRTYSIAVKWPNRVSGACLPDGKDPADMLGEMDPLWAINEIVDNVQPLAQIHMANTIRDLFASGRITDPAKYAGDRITAYGAIAELFIDAPDATRPMAEAAAAQLGLEATDVVRGVIEAWEARNPASGSTDPPPGHVAQPASATAAKQPTGRRKVTETDKSTRRGAEPATVYASARSASGRSADTTALATRHDQTSGIAVWALADGIGQHPEAATAAGMAADIAASVTVRSAPAAGLHAARAAINAYYSGSHASQAGDASLIVVAAYPSSTTRHGVRFELTWAGDCRAYTIRAGQLAQVTTDHTAARQRRDSSESVPLGSIADLLLTSSVRAGDVSVCPLEQGPLLICNNTVHRGVPDRTLAGELAGMSDAQASADRLVSAVGSQTIGNATVLVIHARAAPPALVTTTGTTPAATLAATGSAIALAQTSFGRSPTVEAGPSSPGLQPAAPATSVWSPPSVPPRHSPRQP